MRTMGAILVIATAFGQAACIPVEGDRIFGRELAAAHARFAEIEKNADLGPAPAAGSRRTLRYFELERLARSFRLRLEDGDLREVCFERSVSHLSEEILQPLLAAALQERQGFASAQVEIVDFSRQVLPMGAPEFSERGLDRFGMWHGRMKYGENRSIPIWARVRVVDGTGRALLASSMTIGPEIGKGDPVRVEISSGAVLLAFDAAAESGGHIGEQVTIRNPVNGRRFRAVIEGPGRVGVRK